MYILMILYHNENFPDSPVSLCGLQLWCLFECTDHHQHPTDIIHLKKITIIIEAILPGKHGIFKC